MMDAFGKLADPGFARDTALLVSGYSIAAALGVAAESMTDYDAPTEVYGLVTVVGAEYAPGVSGRQKRHVQLGAGAHTALALGERFGVRDAVEGAM
jgi:hypothetical protein